MSKLKTIYICKKCDAQSPKWSGRCLECGAWSSLEEQIVDKQESEKQERSKIKPATALKFSEVNVGQEDRIKTEIGEVDRVLGGGIVPGSLILLSGEPGIGKSTIVAQIADALQKNYQIVYASGEESAGQVKNRLQRLNCQLNNINFIGETNVEKIIGATLEIKPILLIVDSIQTVYSSSADSEPGNITQIRACAAQFLELAKQKNIAVILIGHITKDGQLAGPKSLEHIVDTVIYLETDNTQTYRILRAQKNRFGSTNELGIFEMTGTGFKQIKNPGAIFLETGMEKLSGSSISCVMEGSRPFMVEIQALATKTVFGYPQRKASGFDLNRLQVISAVLTKRGSINLTNQDIILNIVGGLKLNDPAMDLAVCTSIASSLLNQVIDRQTIILGEVGLGGEVRNISRLETRLKEAEKLGFTKAIIPDAEVKNSKLQLVKVKNVKEVIKNFGK